ncbi:hypothetical protein [Salipiger thiooxidans]|uniref:hypothetical protein n=1 Tax=Salipiger thiooxidans TaxID=282683 RepID=UPI001CD57023|nr:hypothetical protein [Salipiger thiooxidans]MCA0851197.1 hypothetical protein [Salipiger thiooxidans]
MTYVGSDPRGRPARPDWRTEPERATVPQTIALLAGGALFIFLATMGGGWLIAEGIQAMGWDG